MTKKKLLAYVSLALGLAYLAGALLLFGAAMNACTDDFTTITREFSNSWRMPNDSAADPNSAETQIKQEMYHRVISLSTYPSAVAVYDEQGKLIVKSGSLIELYFGNEGIYKLCMLDDFLTPEHKRQLCDYMSDRTYLEISEFKYNLSGDNVIPVSLTVYYVNRSGDKFAKQENLTLNFSDDTAEYTFKNDSSRNLFSTIFLMNIDENHYNRKVYERLNEKITSPEAAKDAATYAESFSGGGYSTSNEWAFYHSFVLGGKKYCAVETAAFRPIIETFLSDILKTFLVEETFLFAILAAVILLAAGKIYDKNKQLENARIAFTGAAAHELKTPLAVISNQCECVLENIAPEKNTEYIASIYDEAKRMNKLVTTLLQYNKLSQLDKISKCMADLDGIAAAEVKKYESLLSEKNITVESDFQGASINCNPELIALVIDNFLSNAAKHTPQNGKIRISVGKGKGISSLTVYNQGSRIENGAHIWDEFYREDKARTSSDNSTGMGLAICKRILELHNFGYGFRNTDGGVEFYFITKQQKNRI